MSGSWPGLPPIDLGGWGDFQRRRLQQAAQERIAAMGATASDWGSQAQRRIDGLTSGIGDIASDLGTSVDAGLDAVQQAAAPIGAAIAQPDAQWNPLAGAEQAFPDDPNAGAKFVAQGIGRGINTAQGQSQQALDAMMGFGPQGPNLAAQALGGLDVATTPYTAPGRATSATATNLGASPEGAALAGGLVGTLGPGGIAGNLARREALPMAGAAAGAAIGAGTGIAAERPAEEVISRTLEGSQVGAGAGEIAPALAGAARNAPDWAQAALDRISGLGTPPQEALGIVNARSYDPTGLNPKQGRLAAPGKPGRAPGPRGIGPVEPVYNKRGELVEVDPESLSAEPFPPGPGPGGEYDIPHPTLGTLKAAPPAPNSYLTSDGFKFWKRVTAGLPPYKADWEQTQANLQKPRYPWDPIASPPPKPGEPGYGRLAGIEEQPLPAPDWDTKLRGWTPKRGTDPETLRHLLNRYAMYERFPHEAVDDLAPSHPALATPEARQAALDDMQDALIKSKARRSQSEDAAIKSERNTRKTREAAEEDAADPDSAGDGTFSYTSTKGVGPDGEKEFHFSSSYEVASAIKFDQDPNVVSWQKGAGPRGRVRVAIDPKYGYNPTDPALMANSDPGPGSEVIYSPDFLLTMKDGSQRVVETKNAGIVHIPAWRIGAKSKEGQRHFEDLWGVGFMMMAEDQLGRPFLRDLAQADLSALPAGHPLRRIRATDVADFQKKMASAWRASRGGASDAQTLENAQHIAQLNSSSKYPPPASLDESVNVQQYLSASRAQAEAHALVPEDGWTFSVDEQGIPLAEGLGGFMVPITPDIRRITYPTHHVPEYRLAQFRHENADLFEAYPDARLTTRKGTDPKIGPTTTLEVTVRAPDGQAAAEMANLYRAPVVYTIDRSTSVPVRRKNWVEADKFDWEGRLGRLKQITGEAAARADRGAAVPDFTDYTGLPIGGPGTPGGAAPARPPRGRGPGRAAAGRGAGVQGVPGAGAGAADRAGAVDRAVALEPGADAGLPAAGDPALAPDGSGSGGLGIARGAGAGRPATGAAPGAAGDWRSALDATLAGLRPYGAARTGGERAFDLATGTAGGVAGAATADEDATWQERAGRFGAGAVAGSLVGPTARGGLGQLARYADRSVTDGVLGITPSGGARSPGDRTGAALTRIPELLSAIPLAAPTSLAANLTGGMARSIERVLGEAAELRPVDAMVDLAGMVRSFPGAVRAGGRALREGPTEANPGMTGAVTPDDLLASTNRLAQVATGGVRANAATDQFWRTLNEAGARAVASRRGLKGEAAEQHATRAGDFATFTGANSVVAKKLTEMKQTVRDPNAGLLDKSVAGAITSMAPYVMMPERLLRATIGSLVPVESATGMVRAFMKGDKAAAREMAGRTAAGLAATTALTYHYFDGGITGDRPEDANEARRREARGEQWNTIATPAGRVPARFLGSLGMQANAIATTLDAARRAKEKGADPGAVIEQGFNGAARWMLDASYLSDLSEFGADVQGPEGAAGALRNVAAGIPSRITGPVTGAIGAADEYEREAENFPEQVMMRTGLRSQLPARIDPATGEAQRRRGSGWERYWGTRGSQQSPEGSELARLRVTPRVIGRTEEYLGAVRSREERRKVQQVLGSETARVVRRTMNAAYYKNAKDIDKKGYLEDAIREAAKAAEARLWKQGIRRVGKSEAEEAAELESAF